MINKNLLGTALIITGTFMVLMITFHLCVISGLLPYDMVWGGRLESRQQMLLFETLSIAANLIVLVFCGLKANVLRWKVDRNVIRVAFWILFGLFLLNAMGNLASENDLEKAMFTPATLLLSASCLVMALHRD